jgi:Fe-S-cluster containining protein
MKVLNILNKMWAAPTAQDAPPLVLEVHTGQKVCFLSKLLQGINKIWVNIRLLLNPANVVIQGECKKCGTCCRNLILVDGKTIVRSQKEFELLKQKDPVYEIFKIKSFNEDGDLVFECTRLAPDNTCSIYNDRPAICANYPSRAMFKRQGRLFKECGYYVEPAVDFQEILETKKK